MVTLTNNNVEFKQLLINEWLLNKERWSEGLTNEEKLSYTQPTEGDLECIIESLIEENVLPDEFDSLLNQALSIFNIT
jgi:hypothetical protein